MPSGSWNIFLDPKIEKCPLPMQYIPLTICGYAGLSTMVFLSVSFCIFNYRNNIHLSGNRNDHRALKELYIPKYYKYIVAAVMAF